MTMDNGKACTVLYRPVGQPEMTLIQQSGYKRFPPRLPEQPIFYPVLNEAYAIQIARDWNTQDDANGNVGFVTKFHVHQTYLAKFEPQQVGASNHMELWIPAKELDEFNEHIQGQIEVIGEYRKS